VPSGAFAVNGSATVKQVPSPILLSTDIFPLWASIIFLTMARPSPVLFSPPVGCTLRRSKVPNSFSCSPGTQVTVQHRYGVENEVIGTRFAISAFGRTILNFVTRRGSVFDFFFAYCERFAKRNRPGSEKEIHMNAINRFFSACRVLPIAAFVLLFAAYPLSAEAESWVDAYRNGDYENAHALLEPLASGGDTKAQYVMALLYHKGLGVDKDYEKAIKWYREAADGGNKAAQNNLGVMYRRGEGVEKNTKEAFSLIWMAAVQGYPRAEYNLANMYNKGEGVPKNPVLAYVWLEFAVSDLPKSGRHVAVNRRAELVTKMPTEDIIRAERMAKALRQARQSG